jgi:photosystem II stability/assembly factor-like uncharacterized protein
VWAVGHAGVALHFDGQSWSVLPTGTRRNLNHLYSKGPSDVWFVGDQGVLLHYDGRQFVPADSGVSSDLDWTLGVSTPAGTHLWAAGDPATLLHRHN